MYNDYKVYGPYLAKDGRLRLFLKKTGVRKTLSYPKYLMEVHLGRYLFPGEDVHHKDGNPLNNNIDNLEICSHSDHCREHSTKYREEVTVTCFYCGKEIKLLPAQQRRNRVNFPVFCYKQCTGRYGSDVQRGVYSNGQRNWA